MAENHVNSLAQTIDRIGEQAFLDELFRRMLEVNYYFSPYEIHAAFPLHDPRRSEFEVSYLRFMAEQSARFLREYFTENMSPQEMATGIIQTFNYDYGSQDILHATIESFESDGDAA